jgi:hypothetical protein
MVVLHLELVLSVELGQIDKLFIFYGLLELSLKLDFSLKVNIQFTVYLEELLLLIFRLHSTEVSPQIEGEYLCRNEYESWY